MDSAPPNALRLSATARQDRDPAQQVVALCRARNDLPGLVVATPTRIDDLTTALRAAGYEVAPHPTAGAGALAIGDGPPRWVIHADPPASLDDYFATLATIDVGTDSEAILLSAATDFARARADAVADPRALQAIDAVQGYTEWNGCRHQALHGFQSHAHPGECGNCDNCLKPPPGLLGAEDARNAIATVIATGERFGTKHLIGVLRGERTETVTSHHHDRLDVWRQGAHLSRAAWDCVMRQLIATGILAYNDDGGIVTTPLSEEVGSGVRTVRFARHIELPDAPMPKRRGVPATKATTRSAATKTATSRPRASGARPVQSARKTEDAKRALYRWRTTFAAEQGVPAIRVLTDPDIGKLAVRRPTTRDELRLIITPSRVDAYGEAILAALADL